VNKSIKIYCYTALKRCIIRSVLSISVLAAFVGGSILVGELAGLSASVSDGGARRTPKAEEVDQKENHTATPGSGVLINVVLEGVCTAFLGRSRSNVSGHVEGGSGADGLAIEVSFEDLVDVHEDTVHDLIQLIGLLGFRNIHCGPNTAVAGCVLNLFVFVLAD